MSNETAHQLPDELRTMVRTEAEDAAVRVTKRWGRRYALPAFLLLAAALIVFGLGLRSDMSEDRENAEARAQAAYQGCVERSTGRDAVRADNALDYENLQADVDEEWHRFDTVFNLLEEASPSPDPSPLIQELRVINDQTRDAQHARNDAALDKALASLPPLPIDDCVHP